MKKANIGLRPCGDNIKSCPQHGRQRFYGGGSGRRTVSKVTDFMNRREKGKKIIGLSVGRGAGARILKTKKKKKKNNDNGESGETR